MKAIEPSEIFRRLPKPPGINDLYTSQAEVLHAWFENRQERDAVVKLHTGGGKTLVGLPMAQSTLNETAEPVLYLASTVQLVNQTIEKAQAIGINAVAYERGQPLNDDFVNANAIMVGTYKPYLTGEANLASVETPYLRVSPPSSLMMLMLPFRWYASLLPSMSKLRTTEIDNRKRGQVLQSNILPPPITYSTEDFQNIAQTQPKQGREKNIPDRLRS